MRICVVGAGAVGGLFGAQMARAGHDVVLLARGPHLQAIRAHGLMIRQPQGAVRVHVRAEDDVRRIGSVDVVFFAVKTYSNPEALPLLGAVAGSHGIVLTLQNGVDSPAAIESVIGPGRVLAGAVYVASAIVAPGVIEQTGHHRRIAFGETAGDLTQVSGRVTLMDTLFREADITSEPAANAWVPLWEKYVYLAPFAAFTGAARQPIGPLWSDALTRQTMIEAFGEVAAVARAERVDLPGDTIERSVAYVDSLASTVRSSLLIDLQSGKPTEVEALLGGVVRRAMASQVQVPIMSALYAVLKVEGARPATSR